MVIMKDNEGNTNALMMTIPMMSMTMLKFREDKPYCANCFGELFAKRC